MYRHQFLKSLHERLQPRTYLEIGVFDGDGLQQSTTRSIGIDPDFHVSAELACDLQLVKLTSDEFFDRPDPLTWFRERVIDLAFIDGMHLFEYAFRDFINVERHAHRGAVIAFDDMLPRSNLEAARDRRSLSWTGDVFRVTQVLEKYRPDLVVLPVCTEPTGLLVVLGSDPTNTVLTDNYDEIVAEFRRDDPQQVPDAVLQRTDAADPAKLLASPVWDELAASRGSHADVDVETLRAARGTATYRHEPIDLGIWPEETKIAERVRGVTRRRARRFVDLARSRRIG